MGEKYHTVNSQWPETVPVLTGEEALAAAKRLYRFAMKKAWRGKWALTSGRRYTWPRGDTYYVNPKRTGWGVENGWHDLVHMVSHYCHRKLHPTKRPHDSRHLYLEREMVAYVIRSGWLEGKLRRPEKAPPDRKAEKAASLEARIRRWRTKHKRAATALKKLERQQRRLSA